MQMLMDAYKIINYYIFSSIFPDLVKEGHLYILQTPLRVRIKKKQFIVTIIIKN